MIRRHLRNSQHPKELQKSDLTWTVYLRNESNLGSASHSSFCRKVKSDKVYLSRLYVPSTSFRSWYVMNIKLIIKKSHVEQINLKWVSVLQASNYLWFLKINNQILPIWNLNRVTLKPYVYGIKCTH